MSHEVELRPDMVTNAVEFLRDPRVLGSSDDRKRRFLLSRGMKDEEVNEAFRIANGTVDLRAPLSLSHTPSTFVVPWKMLTLVFILFSGLGGALEMLLRVCSFWEMGLVPMACVLRR
eukprot:TRINITY_DN5316_c0_g2_i1.p1 TRINITY_DN5316_c0_g2~~TRINITY_DN5316_c0_g2_i1.p1  ORF type:complete len:117 (-),score=11.30 TRINITY_DN5316_c0_g2_i1:407-757(-)